MKSATSAHFTRIPLHYAFEGLEPYINADTMQFHYDSIYKGYIDKLNQALDKYPEYSDYGLEQLILGANYLPGSITAIVFNNAGGIYNHEYYFRSMNPRSKALPEGKLMEAIVNQYGSFDQFKEEFITMAMSVFGSGYAWCVCDDKGKLDIVPLSNQITPLSIIRHPIIALDVWEHAYIRQYNSLRRDYIENWFKVADWEEAEIQYESLYYRLK